MPFDAAAAAPARPSLFFNPISTFVTASRRLSLLVLVYVSIEERHRQYKCFWDLAQMPSRKFSLVVNQVLFALLAYTLLQAHLFLRHRQQIMKSRGAIWVVHDLAHIAQIARVMSKQYADAVGP